MTEDFDSILEQCLSQVGAGKARVQSCLLAYPALEDDLEPLLRAAEWAQAIPKPELSPEAVARIEARLFPKETARRRFRLPSWNLQSIRPARRWALAGLGAITLVVLVAAIALAAMPTALPGSPTYPVKLAAEQAWLWVTPADKQPELHLRLAERRLAELQALAARDVFDSEVATAMMEQVDAALSQASDLAPSVALPVIERADRLNRNQEQLLTGLLATQPEAARHMVRAALQANAEQAQRAQSLFHALEDGQPQPPAPVESPVSPGQTRTPEPPGQLKTAQPPDRNEPKQPQGQSNPPAPPGQAKTPAPPGLEKTPKPDREPQAVDEHRPTKEPKATKEPK